MKRIRSLDFELEPSAVCIGKFDGIHRGHRLLIRAAKETKLPVVMFTFESMRQNDIYSQKEKEYLAEKLGVDIFISISVTESFRHMTPVEFVEKILVHRCHAKEIFIGTDFCFGHNRSGNAGMLKEWERTYSFRVHILEKLSLGGSEVSSTRIRSRLEQGEMEEVSALLGMPYFIQGEVVSGRHLGRTMEIPTANLIPAPGKILPPKGVYAILLTVDGKVRKGVGNLGVKPTVSGDNPMGLEVWIFDFHEDIYGKEIRAHLISYLRPERKFGSMDRLKEQISLDTIRAKEILSQPEVESLLSSLPD
ncbi:MAG: bifunctional riboflavin kinase/FAD synthetase [Eubacterium sp.]|nr:bifunctional riboflavin kinase/FAD synthetase [Eubacterium sp.]